MTDEATATTEGTEKKREVVRLDKLTDKELLQHMTNRSEAALKKLITQSEREVKAAKRVLQMRADLLMRVASDDAG